MNAFDKAYLARRLGAEFDVRVFSSCPSTNTALLSEAKAGGVPLTLFVAEEQTDGRGRAGRSFFSPRGTGIYFSLYLCPEAGGDPTRLTVLSALAVCEAAEKLGRVSAQIKWVNDVYVSMKKCCGILVQGLFEGQGLQGAVVGIGANLFPPEGGFPAEFSARAGAFFEQDAPHIREDFVAEVCLALAARQNEPMHALADAYRRRSCLIGRRVEVHGKGEPFFATVRGIDDECRLLVEGDDARSDTLFAGEVRLLL